MPIDADEVDSAMERYIRKKYQEKSLVDGRPEPPSRADVSPSLAYSPQASPNPDVALPGKKHKFFGFSLRTSSKKDRPGLDNAFKVTPVEYSPTSGQVREIPDRELQEKLAQLNDMGFPDNERNMHILRRSGGDLERTIATLVKMGPSEPQSKPSPAPPTRPAAPIAPSSTSDSAAAARSNNPFEQLDQRAPQNDGGFGLSIGGTAPQALMQQTPQSQSQAPSSNPWQSAMSSQPTQGLEQQFSTLQVSNPLFPHHTGGYTGTSSYEDPRLQTMTPPVPNFSQQYGYAASPTSATSNPFYQPPQPLSSQSTGSNPFYQQQQQSLPVFAPNPSANPFLGAQQSQSQSTAFGSSNPFGLPPSQSQQFPTGQQYAQSPQPLPQNTNPFGIPNQASPPPIQQSQTYPLPSQPQNPNFQYGQPQQQPQSYNAFQQNPQVQFQPQQQSLQPQPTGRYTKTDIMALFNQPSSSQQYGLAPVQEASDDTSQQPPPQLQQTMSPTPSNNPYGAINPSTGKRAATMPVPSMASMHSSGGTGSRNPFLGAQPSASTLHSAPAPFGQGQQAQSAQTYAPQGWQGARHASNESVSVNNPSLMDGRHSPDAFASLSSRY